MKKAEAPKKNDQAQPPSRFNKDAATEWGWDGSLPERLQENEMPIRRQ